VKITIIGTGYVGLVTGACLAEIGHDVVCLDIDEAKINNLIKGKMPIYEPGLDALVLKNYGSKNLKFTSNVELAVTHGEIQFITVGTPADEDGSADLRYVLAAARSIGKFVKDSVLIVNKSTVPVGSASKVKSVVQDELSKRDVNIDFSVASNPEFLKEGDAISDFVNADRIIIGVDSENDELLLRKLYSKLFGKTDRIISMDITSAELTKYAANSMLATRISFMNELAVLSEKIGANIDSVRKGIGSDPRIGSKFLNAGCGYGGSCFPKDIKALIHTAISVGSPSSMLDAVHVVNEKQKSLLPDKIISRFGEDLSEMKVALWGLAFKPDTDDMRAAPSLVLINAITALGAKVVAYDPIANEEASILLKDQPLFCTVEDKYEALVGADILVIVTEWSEFRSVDFSLIKNNLAHPVIYDGRNIWSPKEMKALNFDYYSIGR
jgi:UDPglucose 6-dehydrogenase